jgi:hypothetical protein
MLKDAALLTLDIAETSIQYGMILKDASAYNVQWHNGTLRFIDTLSFEKWNPDEPWIAYRQFCEHFVAPLALMHFLKTPLQGLQLAYPDGMPVHVASSLLPLKSRFHLHTFLHIHLHGKYAHKEKSLAKKNVSFSAVKMKNLFQSLRTAVTAYKLSNKSGVWSGYYDEATQRENYVSLKSEIITNWLYGKTFETALDAGANEGTFSLLLARHNIKTISADFDHYSVNKLYQFIKQEGVAQICPLLLDLSNPAPAIGFDNQERFSFTERVQVDLVLALAVIHHLCIGKNISFAQIATFFKKLGKSLIIEFVPASDSKVQFMLQQKNISFEWYNEENFIKEFSNHYQVMERTPIKGSERVLYLLQTNEA